MLGMTTNINGGGGGGGGGGGESPSPASAQIVASTGPMFQIDKEERKGIARIATATLIKYSMNKGR
jgi:hypothetical protein